ANAIVQPFTRQVIERGQARLTAFDPRHLTDMAPAAVLDGALDVAADGNVVRGKLDIANGIAGTMDEQRVPVSNIAAAVEVRPDAWTLTDLRVGLGSAGELAGSGKASADELALTLHGDGVNLRNVHRALAPTQLAVTMNASGDLSRQQVGLSVAQSNRRLQLDGTVDQGTIAVERARLTAGDSTAEASGTIGLSPDHAFELHANLRRFDPSRFGAFRAGSLNGKFSAN